MPTNDIYSQPYTAWLEGILVDLVDLSPRSICIAFVGDDGQVGTAYFNADNTDRAQMIRSISEDSIIEFIRLNKQYIRDLLADDEDPEEEEDDAL